MILGRYRHIHAARFDELDTAVTEIQAETGDTRVVCFNAHTFEPPPGAIVFNLENVGVGKQVEPGQWPDHEVWDFSKRNAALLAVNPERTRPVRYVPVGYHPSMRRFEPVPMRDRMVDVVFMGTMNERRAKVIEEIRGMGRTVEIVPHHVYGVERDFILAHAKLVLSVRFYPDGLFPTLRSLHALSNGILPVSELAPETPSWEWYAVDLGTVPKLVHETLRRGDEELERRTRDAARVLMRDHRMTLPASSEEGGLA